MAFWDRSSVRPGEAWNAASVHEHIRKIYNSLGLGQLI